MNYLSSVLLENKDQTLLAVVPDKQLLNQSVILLAPHKQFTDWSYQNHADSYIFMQRIARIWKSSNFTNQYLIYGKVDSHLFHWEMVPYQKCRTFIGRAIQQLQVLWRTVFGGIEVPQKEREHQLKNYELLLNKFPEEANPLGLANKGNDSFCREDIIQRQWVLTGKKVHVLFNYAPIGFGGERLHFLVIPKEHRETFTELTQDEYCESLGLTQKLIDHFKETRKTVKYVYIMHKTGEDAGLTVKHSHFQIIFSTNSAQDFWGKVTVMKNILLGSYPMQKDELAKTVGELRKELAVIK